MTDQGTHAERVNKVIRSGLNLSDWEQSFLRDISRWRSDLRPKQEAKLAAIEARASGETYDALTSFLDAMEAAGIVPAEPISDRLGPDKIRFCCEGDRKGRRNGWAKFYDDGLPAGSFGNYKTQIAVTWHMDDGRELSPEERAKLDREIQEREQQRTAEREASFARVAEACGIIWDAADPADPNHGYLAAKGIAGECTRQVTAAAIDRLAGTSACSLFGGESDLRRNIANAIVVPMYDDQGALWNLQRIWTGGRKLYFKDARASGLHMLIGKPGGTIVVAEGYGTGAVIRRATQLPVAVAFTWCNLEHTARLMRDRHPSADIILAADDDAHLVDHPNIQRNIGVEAATTAAQAVGGRVAIPPRKAAA